jgi:hypothetical protein
MKKLSSNRVVLPRPYKVAQHLITRVLLYIGIFILHSIECKGSSAFFLLLELLG